MRAMDSVPGTAATNIDPFQARAMPGVKPKSSVSGATPAAVSIETLPSPSKLPSQAMARLVPSVATAGWP